MNKSDLVEIIAAKLPTMARKEVDLIVDTVFDKMTHALISGSRIEIRGFGSFEIRTRPARQGRNPKTGNKVFVSTRKVPFFKVGKELKEKINQGSETVEVQQQKASGE